MTTENSLWLSSVNEGAMQALDIPLFGSSPPFPYEAFAKALGDLFDLDPCSLFLKRAEWLDEPQDGMGEDPVIYPLSLAPLPGVTHLLFPKNEQKKLLEVILGKKGISDPAIASGFTTYVLLGALDSFNQLSPFGNLRAQMAEKTPIPQTGALCLNFSLTLGEAKLWIRLICPQEMQATFKTHFKMDTPPLVGNPDMAEIPLDLKIEVGQVSMSEKEWKKVRQGDFILLDRCTYDVANEKGLATLTLGQTPLYTVRLKGEEAKILEKAFTEEEIPMTDELPPPEEEEFDFESDLTESDQEKEPLWSENQHKKPAEEPHLPSGEIPLTLKVEVARIKMPLDEVTKLQPGNVLKVASSPELAVHLTIDGKAIAKGELVKLGDALGVKILKTGK